MAIYRKAHPRETQETVFDAHQRAFVFFGGQPKQTAPSYTAGSVQFG